MSGQTMVQIGVELATVKRLERIIARVRQDGDAGREGALDSYTNVVSWAADTACEYGSAQQWALAAQEAAHNAATRGALVLINVDLGVERGMVGAIDSAQGTVTYTPVYATAIAWYLDVARMAGHPAPGEARCERCEQTTEEVDPDFGLCPGCEEYNESRVVL